MQTAWTSKEKTMIVCCRNDGCSSFHAARHFISFQLQVDQFLIVIHYLIGSLQYVAERTMQTSYYPWILNPSFFQEAFCYQELHANSHSSNDTGLSNVSHGQLIELPYCGRSFLLPVRSLLRAKALPVPVPDILLLVACGVSIRASAGQGLGTLKRR